MEVDYEANLEIVAVNVIGTKDSDSEGDTMKLHKRSVQSSIKPQSHRRRPSPPAFHRFEQPNSNQTLKMRPKILRGEDFELIDSAKEAERSPCST